ncbi:MAG: SulP family inorganic anion transporter [Halobacteriovoraceae bacterium]|nr:SulP family inorganic anion transporter [Halobacteriovoraceae bacterium]|tara:strand:+ start:1427 stop:2908 length:1482 start_codon:yes stop_codon:yes gene_type:complete
MKLHYSKNEFWHDFLASLVVFLVALPLCLGIALASGVPPIVGLMAGIIGGLVVGTFTGSPLQVSGPAAGLAVMVYEVVQVHGLEALGIVCLIAGLVQVAGYFLKLGNYFKAVSPAVVKGMLSGIGLLIFASQFHVMLDHAPKSSGTQNLITIPEAFIDIFGASFPIQHMQAATIGLITLIILVGWNFVKDKIKLPIPAPLIAIVSASLIANLSGLQINYIELPDNLLAGMNFIGLDSFGSINLDLIIAGIGMALVATTETLLCVTAVDSIKPDHKSDYDQELLAQGLGNSLAGIIGAMPITGVIVRSSANLEFGGRTRGSTIMHGLWLVAFLFLFSELLGYIPTSALAAILVYTGYKLFDIKAFAKFSEFGKFEVFIYVATIASIVTINLLYGVIIGYALALVQLIYKLNHCEVNFTEEEGALRVDIQGSMTFLSLPKLSEEIDKKLEGHTGDIYVNTKELRFMDSASHEFLEVLNKNLGSSMKVISEDKKIA